MFFLSKGPSFRFHIDFWICTFKKQKPRGIKGVCKNIKEKTLGPPTPPGTIPKQLLGESSQLLVVSSAIDPPFMSHETAFWEGPITPLRGWNRSPWLLTTYYMGWFKYHPNPSLAPPRPRCFPCSWAADFSPAENKRRYGATGSIPRHDGMTPLEPISHSIHVWYIHLHLPWKSTKWRWICHTWILWVYVSIWMYLMFAIPETNSKKPKKASLRRQTTGYNTIDGLPIL